ncbi:hypothetical protein HNQ03_003276 [Chryseobacterium sp. 16F]|uniref:Uncharacterized protein n=1 Tax=Frigoriflavimonas asaccharolytica TaxID=2735899 RepID=A0A8J8K6W0_9FLAO|nr:hypothetical protein [Frigoriflavimonas asaccharolytica]
MFIERKMANTNFIKTILYNKKFLKDTPPPPPAGASAMLLS